MANARPVIVEGPDGSGKTTLAKQLATLYGLQYTRPPVELLSSTTGPGIGLVEWWEEQLAKSSRALGKLIYDRCFYLSDPIYQQAQAERMLLVPSDRLAAGIMKLWAIEPILILCLPPFEVQLANVKRFERDRLVGVDDLDLEKISNQYWAYYAMWSNAMFESVIRHDYTEADADERLQQLLYQNKLEAVK